MRLATCDAKKESPALLIIRHFAAHEGCGLGRSRERFTSGMNQILHLAIAHGLPFALDDMGRLTDMHMWPHEGNYGTACGRERGRGNMSFCQAYEKWKGRKPFLLIAHPSLTTKSRVFEGFEFSWYGERAACTSFSKDQNSFTACTYKPREEGEYGRKVAKRIKITHADLAEYHKTYVPYFNQMRGQAEKALLASAGAQEADE